VSHSLDKFQQKDYESSIENVKDLARVVKVYRPSPTIPAFLKIREKAGAVETDEVPVGG
jgi:hypothetical protein